MPGTRPDPRRPPAHILLTSRFSSSRSVNYLGYSWISPGGDRLTHFVSNGTNHARKEPGRSRDSPVTLLHCSIRTRRIRTALATRRAQRGSPAQGYRVRTAAGIRSANPCLAWIHGSVPQVQPRPCGRSLIGSEINPAQVRAGSGTASWCSFTYRAAADFRWSPTCFMRQLAAGAPALHRSAVACRCALPRNRSREDRKASLPPARSPGRAPVSAGRTARTRPRGSRCAPGARAVPGRIVNLFQVQHLNLSTSVDGQPTAACPARKLVRSIS